MSIHRIDINAGSESGSLLHGFLGPEATTYFNVPSKKSKSVSKPSFGVRSSSSNGSNSSNSRNQFFVIAER